MDSNLIEKLTLIANRLRIHSVNATNSSNSGHPTSCASIAEVMSVLFFHTMRYSVKEPKKYESDRLILSKGHAAPILYAAWCEAGLVPATELLNLRSIHSDLEGHPTPRLPFVDVATGSLGQGLSISVGMAYAGKYLDKTDFRTYCIIGDGESAEGSIWEALSFASHYHLDNLVAIFDVNRLGQSNPTQLQHESKIYSDRITAFGWNTIVVDGHDVAAVVAALDSAKTVSGKPTALVAVTFKGKGFVDIEDKLNWHGKPLGNSTQQAFSGGLSSVDMKSSHGICPAMPTSSLPPVDINAPIRLASPPTYNLGDMVATRLAYGTALAKLGQSSQRVVAMDGDTSNSTFSIKFREACPDRYVECFIAEQNLVGVAVGAACRDRHVTFASTFAVFFTRAFDQLRMAAISRSNANFAGSHVGVSIGEDGPSQMGLEDLAMFRAIPTSTVFYPSDAVSCERAVELAANTKGICYIRTSRPNQAVLYKSDEEFVVGRGKVLRQSDKDAVTIVAAGVTLTEALKAADTLASQGINVRVMDPFTIKPLDTDLLGQCARATSGKILVVEDHYPQGGIFEAVSSSVAHLAGFAVRHLAVNGVPRSGKSAELLAMFKIDAAAIVDEIKSMAQ